MWLGQRFRNEDCEPTKPSDSIQVLAYAVLRANSHCLFALDFPSTLVYIIGIRHARPPEPQHPLRHGAQLPLSAFAALFWSMVSSRHSLGTFRHLWQAELPLCPWEAAQVFVPGAEPSGEASPDLCPQGLAATRSPSRQRLSPDAGTD